MELSVRYRGPSGATRGSCDTGSEVEGAGSE